MDRIHGRNPRQRIQHTYSQSNPRLIIGDICPATPVEGLLPEQLIARTQALENEIRMSKQRHEETLQKFKSSSKVWKEGTKRLGTSAPANAAKDALATRVDGVAAAAKDAESAVSNAMAQPTMNADQVEEINRQVLAECGIPNARIRAVQKVRPVGKHIEYQPAKKSVIAPPGPPVVHRHPVRDAIVPSPVQEAESPEPTNENESEVVDEDGLANEAFEAMEAMEFDTGGFDYDSENHDSNGMTMDMGVD